MEIKYQIQYQIHVVKKHIPLLSATAKTEIKKAIEKKLMTNPISFGKPLQYSLKGHRSLRVGNYRVIFRIEEEANTVIIIAIKHRKEVYETSEN